MEVKRVRAKVIMLPTENKQDNIPLHLGVDGKLRCNYSNRYANVLVEKAQHLYFTTDEEIKEGDWYIDDCNLIRQAVTSDKDYWDRRPTYKKIVTSTDKSLGLPQPSQAFIQKYCELGGIDEVDIELKSSDLDYFFGDLKVDSHNTITIHSVKDSWSREEMFQLMDNYQNYLIETDRTVKSFEEWFNS